MKKLAVYLALVFVASFPITGATAAPKQTMSVIISGPTTVCQSTGGSYRANETGGTGTLTYQWEENGVDVTTQHAGDPAFILTLNTIPNNAVIVCIVTSSTGSQATSNSLTIIVTPDQTFTAGMSVSAIQPCQGSTETFTANSNLAASSYQWSLNGSAVSGATGSTYSLTATSVSQLQSVGLTITTTASCVSNTSSTINTSGYPFVIQPVVTPTITISSSPSGPICPGTTVNFTATSTNGGTPAYQWYLNGSRILGANSSTYTTSSLTNGQVISCMMSSNVICATPITVTSNSITQTVKALVGAPSAPSGPAALPEGSEVRYYTSASAAASFNWSMSPAAAGYITDSGIVFLNATYLGSFTVSVSANGCGGPTTLESTTVSVYTLLTSGAITPAYTLINAGTYADSLTVAPAAGGNCNGNYIYQWQQSSDNSHFTSIPGVNGLGYNPEGPRSTTYIRTRVICGTDTAYSNTSVIDVNAIDTGDLNYIRERILSRPGVTDTGTASQVTNPFDVQQTTIYYDGLGRSVQTVQKEASPLQHDIVSIQLYDPFNRESTKYLSYTSSATDSADGNYKPNAISEEESFNAAQYPGEQFYYGQTAFEASPLNRPLNTYAPGMSWVGSGRSSSISYQVNGAQDSVVLWNIASAQGSLPGMAGFYSVGQLYKNITTDEAGHKVVEFMDKNGLTILKKVQLSGVPGSAYVGWLCTYYVYDYMNLLRFVIPPQAVTLINTGATWTMPQAIANNYCYQYEYDSRHRMIVKKVPGAGEVWMAYDIRDRLVMTQDSNLRATHQWLVTQYDSLDRPVETGLITYAATLASLQQLVTNQTSGLSSAGSLSIDTTLTSQNTTGDIRASGEVIMYNGFTTGSSGPFIGEVINGNWGSGGSSSNSNSIALTPVPPGVTLQPLTLTYYDDYAWVAGSGTTLTSAFASAIAANSNYFITAYNTSPVYAVPITAHPITRGEVTGTQSLVLGTTGQYLTSVNFYDDRVRLIQTQSVNYTDGLDTVTTQYDFTGKALRNLLGQAKSTNTAQFHRVLTKNNYDAGFRVTSIYKNIDGAASDQLIDSMTYDELSQLRVKYLGKDPATGQPLDSLVYDYNIRGWITGINKNFIAGTTKHYFGMELGYDKPNSVSGTSYANPVFNGNIAGTIWKSAGDGVNRKYDFTYDDVNRLTGAAYLDNKSGSWSTSLMNYSVSNLTYDANGNIMSMNQNGFKVGSPGALIDSLAYSYVANSNKLLQVNDAMNDTASVLGDFHYKGTQPGTYTYDGNGSLTKDGNKSIDTIYYNYLNLPQQVHMKGKGNIFYTYDATGNKLRKQTVDSTDGLATTTLYMDGFQYQRQSPISNTASGVDTLQFVAHEEGRSRWAPLKFLNGDSAYAWTYDFMEKDHLGNTRVLLSQEKDTAQYMATMEPQFRALENALFYNIDSTAFATNEVPGGYPTDNTTNPNDSVAMVSGSPGDHTQGPAIILKVMAGDSISVGVKSYYVGGGSVGPTTSSLPSLLSTLAGGLVTLGGPTHGALTSLGSTSPGSPAYMALNSFLPSNDSTPTTGKPKAYLNWMLLDNQFSYVSGNGQSGAMPVGSPNLLNPLATKIKLQHSGYLYIWVSNETQNWDVFFDNLSIEHFSGPMVEEEHYYPFGLTMAGISDKALKNQYAENKYRFDAGTEFQNKEFSDGSGLEMYETDFRGYDPQIGRFWQIDPLGDLNEGQSPYSFADNNPILMVDPSGLAGDSTVHDSGVDPMAAVTVVGHKANCQTCSSPTVEAGPPPDQGSAVASGPAPPKDPTPSFPTPTVSPLGPTNSQPSVTVRGSNTSYLDMALKYSNVPYVSGHASPKGYDCSGLVCMVTGTPDHGWSTSSAGPPPGNWKKVDVSHDSYQKFISNVLKGDLFLWRGQHVAFYAGDERIYGAHKPGVNSGYSRKDALYNELKQYWIQNKGGYPEVYRQY